MSYNSTDDLDSQSFIKKLKSLGGDNHKLDLILYNLNFIEGVETYSNGKSPISSLYNSILKNENLIEKDKGYSLFAWILRYMAERGETELTDSLLSAAGDLGMFEEIDSEIRGEMISYSLQIAQERKPGILPE